jgi:hypothetical protein
VVGILDFNPLEGLEFAEIGFSVVVVTHILRKQQRTAH